MGQGHSRKKRRPRFQKPDTINIILGSLAVILILAWGGLYWDKSTDQSFVVNAKGAPPVIIAALDGTVIPTEVTQVVTPSSEVKTVETAPTVKPSEQAATNPDRNEEVIETPEAASEQAVAVKPAVKPAATPRPVQTTKPVTTSKPNKGTDAKPNTGVSPKPDEETAIETEPPVNAVEKYEEQMRQLQAKCTQDMNAVLAGAEASVAQLDLSDPYAFQELNQKWMDGLSNTEAACNAKLQTLIADAEGDKVEQSVTEEWEQTYSSLMLQLQGDFEAKLLQLMGG
ncbi:hypothetical protein [Paenibacillus sinopodophylli]|uniref:hypothetical protein n=1 Tax=Paenibacillus sinopodophylli TaxID=1837342 RepID=UPI00110D0291|nr:hypothetical protein [Paenibacillus sinopodophylli]